MVESRRGAGVVLKKRRNVARVVKRALDRAANEQRRRIEPERRVPVVEAEAFAHKVLFQQAITWPPNQCSQIQFL